MNYKMDTVTQHQVNECWHYWELLVTGRKKVLYLRPCNKILQSYNLCSALWQFSHGSDTLETNCAHDCSMDSFLQYINTRRHTELQTNQIAPLIYFAIRSHLCNLFCSQITPLQFIFQSDRTSVIYFPIGSQLIKRI